MRALLVAALFLSPQAEPPTEFVVAPDGKDSNPGTKDAPFATVARARDAARPVAGKKPVHIYVRGGTYFLPEPLAFTAEDSGTPDFPFVVEAFPGERPVLSGGRRVTGWKKGENGVWTAPVSGDFRQLFVDGRRATRARSPNRDFFRVRGAVSLEPRAKFLAREGDVKPEWAARGEVEVVVLQAWAEMRSPIAAVDGATVTLAGKCAPSNREADARYWVENAIEMLDAPGEWFLDRKAGVLSYIPPEGQDPSKAEVIAPALPELVRFEGARHVGLIGLTLSHSDWAAGPKGYTDVQAAFDIPGAVRGERAVACRLDRCTVAHVGGYGIEFARGCRDNVIARCEVTDAGAGGIKIGETALRKDEADQTSSNTVLDNHVHDLGLVYPAGVGVWVGHSSKNVLSHNHVHDTYYSGFSIGWSWGYGPSGARENVIEQNLVHDIGRGMLADMGGIYTLGTCTGTVIRNNVFRDVRSSTYGGWGIYFDEGSTGILAEGNVVYRCKSNGFHQHYGKENTLRNNVFALNSESQIARTRAESHHTLTVERNVFYWTTGTLLSGDWGNGTFRFEKNVYWNPKGGAGTPADWAAKGWDKDSIAADPLFVDPEKGDFSLRPDSPALKLGFKPIDVSKAGPRR